MTEQSESSKVPTNPAPVDTKPTSSVPSFPPTKVGFEGEEREGWFFWRGTWRRS